MLKNKRLIFFILFYGFLFSFFYNVLKLNFKGFAVHANNVTKTVYFELPVKDTYNLKIWFLRKFPFENMSLKVNKHPLQRWSTRVRSKIQELNFFIPPEAVYIGLNELKIANAPDYFTSTVRVTNYYGKIKPDNAFVLFDTSMIFENDKLDKQRLLFFTILFFFILTVVHIGFEFFLQKYFRLSINDMFFYFSSPYIICLFLLFLAVAYSLITPFRIIFSRNIFITWFLLALNAQVFLVFFYLKRHFNHAIEAALRLLKAQSSRGRSFFIKGSSKSPDNARFPVVEDTKNIDTNSVAREIKLPSNVQRNFIFFMMYIKRNQTFKFAFLFIALILMCVFFLVLRCEFIAIHLANIAYLVFFLAVIIKIISLKKE